MKRVPHNKKQKGFSVLAVILVIVAVIVAIGVWALSGQTNTNNTGTSTTDIQVTSIINDSNAIKLAYDNLLINGSSATSIVFIPNTASTGTAPNILDPTTGIQSPKVNSNILKTALGATEGYWVYNPTGVKTGVGSWLATDPVIIVAGIKNSICQRINNNLNGTTSIPVSGLATSAASTTGATATAPTSTTSMDIGSIGGTYGWMAGCITTTANGDDNFFFRVLKVY